MTKPIVIAVSGQPQGVVVPAEGDYRFLAVKLGVFPLDGRLFKSVADAHRAARAVMEGSAVEGGEDPLDAEIRDGMVA